MLLHFLRADLLMVVFFIVNTFKSHMGLLKLYYLNLKGCAYVYSFVDYYVFF